MIYEATPHPERLAMTPGPLSGVLVIDLTRVLAGPYCTMMLAELGARVIKVENPGCGQTGPWRHKPAYDMIVQAQGGIMSMTGDPDGPPTKAGTSVGDITGGLFTALGIAAALHHREKTGLGMRVDVSMLDGQIAI